MQGHASFAPVFLIFYSACHICLQFVLFCHFLCAFHPMPNTLGIYLQFKECIADEVGQFLMGTPKGKEGTSVHSRGEITGWPESKYPPCSSVAERGEHLMLTRTLILVQQARDKFTEEMKNYKIPFHAPITSKII